MDIIPSFLIAIGMVWIMQSIFSFSQNILIRNSVKNLTQNHETLYVDRNAGFLKTKQIILLAVDEQSVVTGANKLRTSKILRPPKMVPFKEIVGMRFSDLPGNLDCFDAVTRQTLKNIISKARSEGGLT